MLVKEKALREIAEEIKKIKKKNFIEAREEIKRIKARISRKYKINIPKNSEIMKFIEDKNLKALLTKKPVRTISGVAVVAVMAKPYPCPGRCIYCPRGENAPQSYTGYEPATLRAKRANYDPYLQVHDRLRQLSSIGHSIEKVELIIMGGTFLASPVDYQKDFVARCFKAMNDFPSYKNEPISLEEAHRENEVARVRCVGLTIETRPDFSKEEHVDLMLSYGTTRVELGVQTIKQEIYDLVNRGHTVDDVVEATRILKDAGLKVCYHMMPGLFSSLSEDLEMFKEIFKNENFKPDMLKIYPTLVVKGTELYEMWKRGEYKPYSDEEAVELIKEIKKILPPWVRVMRIQRDIPSELIVAGVKKSNLAELVIKALKEDNARCMCIRCREVGHVMYRENVEITEDDLKIFVESYKASKGKEFFLSIEDKERLAVVGYLRLRFPSKHAHRWEVDEKTAIIRELKVLGTALPLKEKEGILSKQHKGYGRLLVGKAEEIAEKHGKEKVLITSAVGTREYYRKLGYRRYGVYMGKML